MENATPASPPISTDQHAHTSTISQRDSHRKWASEPFNLDHPPTTTQTHNNNSSLHDDDESTTDSTSIVDTMLARASTADGSIDVSKLKHLLRHQKRAYNERLKIEAAKRDQLELLLLKLNTASSAFPVSPHSSSASLNTSSSSRLCGLVAHELASSKRSSRKLEEKQRQMDSLVEGRKENFYESTSLFSQVPPLLTLENLLERGSDEPQRAESGASTPKVANFVERRQLADVSNFESGRAVRREKEAESWFAEIDFRTDLPKLQLASVRSIELSDAPSLQVSLRSKLPSFVDRSLARQQAIAHASSLRREADRQLRAIARDIVVGVGTMPDARVIERLAKEAREIQAFPAREMRERTRKKCEGLPEAWARKKRVQRELERATNRVQAEIFKQRILYRAVTQGRPTH